MGLRSRTVDAVDFDWDTCVEEPHMCVFADHSFLVVERVEANHIGERDASAI